jgi:hypothetical protein
MNIEHLQLIMHMMELMKNMSQLRFYPLTTETFQHWSTLKWTMRYLNWKFWVMTSMYFHFRFFTSNQIWFVKTFQHWTLALT